LNFACSCSVENYSPHSHSRRLRWLGALWLWRRLGSSALLSAQPFFY